MDFNPLDILATAALGEKGPGEKGASASQDQSTSDQEDNSESTESESKDADDDQSNEMGKTKHNSINSHPSERSANTKIDMAPQKLSWSPDMFVSCLDKPFVDPKKLIMEELSADVVKEKMKAIQNNSEETKVNVENIFNSVNNGEAKKFVNSLQMSNVIEGIPDVLKEGFTSPPKEQNVDKQPSMTPSLMDESKDESSRCNNAEEDLLTENGGQSDTDTADTTDSKIADEISEITCQDLINMDHPYCSIPGQLRRVPSMDNTDDDIDVCSDNSPFTEDSDQRSRNFSLDCSYLKSGFMEAESAGPPDFYKCSLSKFKGDGINMNSSSAFKHVGVISPDRQGQKCGKYKIGTFASFSSRNLELEKYLRSKEPSNGKKLDIGIPSDNSFPSPTPNSPNYSSVHTLLQSPSLDWDRSEAGSETQDDSSDARTPHRLSPDFTIERPVEWSHPMYHDHDYCNKTSQPKHVIEESVKLPKIKRKYTKRKTKLDSINHEKIMKAKYLKKELLKQDSVLKSAPLPLPETPVTVPQPVLLKTNPVGRPRKRPYDKSGDEEIDPETGAKMKITGKFQDQYVYYLSKSYRTTSRRRQTPTIPLPADKILVPAPKPGDIFVPHLTDADIEIVRQKGRGALNIPDRPHMPSIPTTQTSCIAPPALSVNHSSELISDVDSHIVSTILSMENDNLVSPSSSQSPELPDTPELYNTQSDLDNLRMMNSDSSITSDHVLNYLLSGVKDDDNSDNLLQSSASLFPPLPSDPLYSKAGQLDVTDLGGQGREDSIDQKLESAHFNSKYIIDQCSSSDSDLLPSDSVYSGNSFVNSITSSKADDGSTLPDVLSSFIAQSQEPIVTSTSNEGDSQSSVKSVFSPDLSSLDAPQMSGSVPRLTSIEKTLDFLGVKDGKIELENDDLFGSKMSQEVVSSPMSTTDSLTDDTPWIVTVTLYFNDVPAIMINSTPFIRLVDIHKQILPAKDTGILKKRCQLLSIQVLNCTEMQRYFLVQYGRAYNSKSTLIVSKEQANVLVTYYATPQPRIGRSEEAHVRRLSNSVSSDGSNLSPVDSVASYGGKKRGNIKNRKATSQHNGVLFEPVGSHGLNQADDSSPQDHDQSLNKRTRHKKINYLEMLKGEEKEKEKSTEDSIRETIEAVARSSVDITDNLKVSRERSNVKQSKKKHNKHEKGDNKSKEASSQRRKSTDSKKKVKGNDKVCKASKDKSGTNNNKAKGSTWKFLKKSDKKVISSRSDEVISDHNQQELDLHSSKSKCKPLKLKVNGLFNFAGQRKVVTSPTKKGLFSRSNSSTSTSEMERPVRVLAVAHQAAIACEDTESHLPSQPADIHLDLFTKSSSACVRCHTCSQFLSVPHFMRHHHVPMDSEWLATESAHRILVPRNKENISEVERKLWEEFHRLQEAIGGFGDEDSDCDDEEDDDDDDDDCESIDEEEEQLRDNDSEFAFNSKKDRSLTLTSFHDADTSVASSKLSDHKIEFSQSLPNKELLEDNDIFSSKHGPSNRVQSANKAHQLAETCNAGTNMTTKLVGNPVSVSHAVSMSVDQMYGQDSGLHVRTSSRKRKSKQLFSIENYCTPTKRGAESDGVCQSSASG